MRRSICATWCRRYALPALLAAGLAGCATITKLAAPEAVLLSPSSLARTVHAQQQLEAEYDGQAWSMQGALEVTPREVRLAGLTPFGQRLILLRWDGSKLSEERDARLPERIQGERILADLQLIYWPLPALSAGLPSPWRVEEGAGLRTVFYDGKPFIQIRCDGADPWQGRCVFEHLVYGYRLTLDSQLDAP